MGQYVRMKYHGRVAGAPSYNELYKIMDYIPGLKFSFRMPEEESNWMPTEKSIIAFYGGLEPCY